MPTFMICVDTITMKDPCGVKDVVEYGQLQWYHGEMTI